MAETKTALDGFFRAIQESGKEMKKVHQQLRDKITTQGEPDAVVVTDAEHEEEFRMWGIDGGVTVIGFRKGRADLNNIVTYNTEFVYALLKCCQV